MRGDRQVRYERVDFDSDPDDNDQLRARRKLAKDLAATRRKGNCERLIRSVFVLALLLATAAAAVTLFVYRTDIYEMVSDADAFANKIVDIHDHNDNDNQTLSYNKTANEEDLNSTAAVKQTSQSTGITNAIKNDDNNDNNDNNDDNDDMSFVDDVDDSGVEYPDFDDEPDDDTKAKSRSKRSAETTNDFNEDNASTFTSSSSSSSSSASSSAMSSEMETTQNRKRSTLSDNSTTTANNGDNSTTSNNGDNSTTSNNEDNATNTTMSEKNTTIKEDDTEESSSTLYTIDTDQLWTKLDELDLLALCVLGAVSALSVLLMLFCFSRMLQARRRSRRQQFRRLVNDLNASEKYTIITPSDDELSD